MKKFLCLGIVFALCLCMASCGANRPKKLAEDAFRIVITNKSGESIRGVTLNYSVYGKEIASCYVSGGNDSLIFDGETIQKDFSVAEFEGSDVHVNFAAQATVVNGDNKNIECINTMSLLAEYGNTYYYMLDGNSQSGFHFAKLSQPIEE